MRANSQGFSEYSILYTMFNYWFLFKKPGKEHVYAFPARQGPVRIRMRESAGIAANQDETSRAESDAFARKNKKAGAAPPGFFMSLSPLHGFSSDHRMDADIKGLLVRIQRYYGLPHAGGSMVGELGSGRVISLRKTLHPSSTPASPTRTSGRGRSMNTVTANPSGRGVRITAARPRLSPAGPAMTRRRSQRMRRKWRFPRRLRPPIGS